MAQKRSRKWIPNSLVALSLLFVSSSAMAGQAPLTGAIFTTKIDGIPVNSNVYDHKEDVYLNGGPHPNRKCDAAGLPFGIYYFQVTDPSGKDLLSTDDISHRRVKVDSRGVFVYDQMNDVTDHYMPQVDPAVDGTVQLPAKCGSITVQLAPFDNTPNPGGEYKVWITRVTDYDPTTLLGSFGFIPSKSKTDNFKVVNPAAPDSDGDGIPDSEDPCPIDPTNNCLGDT